MALVPRRVRVTSVALYSFIITNISGLSTTLVPLLRARYDSTHVFHFFAEPLAGSGGATTINAAVGSNSADHSSAVGFLRATSGGDGEGTGVEFSVSESGSLGLQKAMLWMYPGMFLASSGEAFFVPRWVGLDIWRWRGEGTTRPRLDRWYAILSRFLGNVPQKYCTA